MRGKPRWWLGGAVREPRDLPLIRRVLVRMRRCAGRQPLWRCPDGVVTDSRAIREPGRAPGPTGTGGRPRLRPWPHAVSAHVLTRSERRRVVETARRRVDGTPARVETRRCRAQGDGVSPTASRERRNATFRERLAPLERRCRALARHTLPWHEGRGVVGTV